MIIVAGGDSFIFGAELADCTADTNRASQQVWPAVLARGTADYVCTARNGASNQAIARRVIEYCESNQQQQLAVIVQWTFPGRYEFKFAFDTGQQDTWQSIGSWDIIDDVEQIEKEYHTNNASVSATQRRHLERAKRTGLHDFAKQYFKGVASTEYWEIYTTLKEIVYLQNYLKVNQIPYMFACADNIVVSNATITQADASIMTLYNQIDFGSWAMFPAGTHPGETLEPRGFYQWAVENKYPMGTTHPLAQAHAAAAQLMKDKFNDLVKKHLQ
jgi:hypothetical protein